MKRFFGILLLSCICMLLGLSVKWSRANDISLVSEMADAEISPICYE